MSGIVGWVDYGRDVRTQGAVLRSMVGTLATRGPDAERVWLGQHAGLGPLLHVAREERLLAYDFAAHGWQLCYVDSVCAYRAAPTAHAGHAQERRLALRDELVVSWLRRPARECVRATVALLRRCTHDRAAFLATLGAFRRLAWTIVERERLPADVEHRIRLEERAAEGRS